jgi:hypothetical protein
MDKSKLYEKLDEMVEIMGAEQMLDALVRALSSDVLEDNLRYINRCYETNVEFD